MKAEEIKYAHPLQDMKTDEICSWLECGLRGYLQGKEGAWAFEKASFYIGKTDHLVMDISELYAELPPGSLQVRFREAVALLLARLPAESGEVVLFEHLLGIAAVTRAYEVLPVLRRRIGRGFFGLTDNLDGHNLFIQTLDFVAGLAIAPDAEVLNTLDDLIASPRFDPAYADLALLAYCRIEDKKLPSHLAKLRGAFAELQKRGVLDDVVARNIARQVVETLGLKEIARVLPLLIYVSQSRPTANTDLWFVRALLQGEDSIVTWGEENNETYLYSQKGLDCYPIPIPTDMFGNYGDMLAFLRSEGKQIEVPDISEDTRKAATILASNTWKNASICGNC